MKRETAEGGLARRLAALNAARCAALTGWENLMNNTSLYVSRTDGRTVPCPYCGVKPGEKCQGKRGTREANHRERIELYVELYRD